jgi:hypothetical protein
MANGRAATISIAQLSSAVNQAVKTAETKHKIQFEGTTVQYVPNWQILGRILREATVDFGQAQQFANDVAQAANHVAAAGGVAAAATTVTTNFQPAIVWNGRHIICGIWPAPEVILSE